MRNYVILASIGAALLTVVIWAANSVKIQPRDIQAEIEAVQNGGK